MSKFIKDDKATEIESLFSLLKNRLATIQKYEEIIVATTVLIKSYDNEHLVREFDELKNEHGL